MTELRIGADLETQVGARHLAAAHELDELRGLPPLGPGPGTLPMLRIFAAVLQCSDGLATTNAVTADAVGLVAESVRRADEEIGRQLARMTTLDVPGPVAP